MPQRQTKPQATQAERQSLYRLALFAAAAFFMTSVIRHAWVADDGFIFARSFVHAAEGKGLVLNLGQRVQTFTSPLWTLLCIPLYWLLENPYNTLICAGLTCSTLMTLTFLRAFRSRPLAGATLFLLLSASASILSFSTAGLENSLAHFLVSCFAIERIHSSPKSTRLSWLLAVLILLTRFDLALIVVPACLLALRNAYQLKQLKKAFYHAFPALVLLCLWCSFALVYYGGVLPNTAYAKLNTEIAFSDKALQGLSYAVDLAYRDPLLFFCFLLGLSSPWLKKGTAAGNSLLAGAGLYLTYLFFIGGDFMSGRFFSVPGVLIAFSLCQLSWAGQRMWSVASAILFFFAAQSWSDRKVDRRTECHISQSGITDERACYVEHTGLTQNLTRFQKWRLHPYLRDYKKAYAERLEQGVLVFHTIGMVGFSDVATEAHIVEPMALSDPLLSRIRIKPKGKSRTGHYRRPIPSGYLASLRTGKNLVKDPCLHQLYARLSLIHSAPLFSTERLRAIVALPFPRRRMPRS